MNKQVFIQYQLFVWSWHHGKDRRNASGGSVFNFKQQVCVFLLIHLYDQLNIDEEFLPNLINISNKIPPFSKEHCLRYCVSVGR